MALGLRGRGASGKGLASETPATATAPSGAAGSRRFLLCLYLVGFLVSALPGAGEKALSLFKTREGLHVPPPARKSEMCCQVSLLALSALTSSVAP